MGDFKNTIEFFGKIEEDSIRFAQKALKKDNRNASHRLYVSLSEGFIVDFLPNIHHPNKIVMKWDYADHGKYVLDSRRRIQKKHPSAAAIQSLKDWITNKAIPVGRGRMRTPLRNKSTQQLYPTTHTYKPDIDKQKTAFARAIWYSIRKNQSIMKNPSTKRPPTLFTSHWINTFNSNTFNKQLRSCLSKDGFTMLFKDLGDLEIHVK